MTYRAISLALILTGLVAGCSNESEYTQTEVLEAIRAATETQCECAAQVMSPTYSSASECFAAAEVYLSEALYDCYGAVYAEYGVETDVDCARAAYAEVEDCVTSLDCASLADDSEVAACWYDLDVSACYTEPEWDYETRLAYYDALDACEEPFFGGGE